MSSPFLTHWLLENPWPAAALLLIVGGVIAWRAMQENRTRQVAIGAGLVLVGFIVAAIGWLTTTPGEHAKVLTRELVAAVEAGDVISASGLFADDAIMNFERPENPGHSRDDIDAALSAIIDVHRIEQNQITDLDGATLSSDTGVAELTCWTQTSTSMGNVPSRWILRAKRQSDGSWEIARITCVSVAGGAPDMRMFR